VSNTLSRCHRCIPSHASGLVLIANALIEFLKGLLLDVNRRNQRPLLRSRDQLMMHSGIYSIRSGFSGLKWEFRGNTDVAFAASNKGCHNGSVERRAGGLEDPAYELLGIVPWGEELLVLRASTPCSRVDAEQS